MFEENWKLEQEITTLKRTINLNDRKTDEH